MDDKISLDGALQEAFEKEFREEARSPEFRSMLRLGMAVYTHALDGYGDVENIVKWVRRMYEGGVYQRRLSKGELDEEGGILNFSGAIIAAGACLARDGKEEGYLSSD